MIKEIKRSRIILEIVDFVDSLNLFHKGDYFSYMTNSDRILIYTIDDSCNVINVHLRNIKLIYGERFSVEDINIVFRNKFKKYTIDIYNSVYD